MIAKLILIAAVLGQPADVPAKMEPAFVHPPLKCMARFENVVDYPIIAWCYPARGDDKSWPGYGYKLAHQADACGFNVLIANPKMISAVSQFDRMTLLSAAFYQVRGSDGKALDKVEELSEALDGAKDENLKYLSGGVERFGAHPRLAGLVVVHNSVIKPWVPAGKWMAEKHPALVPYVASNGDPAGQIGTPFSILGTQNFRLKVTSAPADYLAKLDADRTFSNRHNMAFWPMFHAPCSPSKYRLQIYSALAYGAQGVVAFVFCPCDKFPEWQEGGQLATAVVPIHRYIKQIVGKHLWGCRSVQTFHSAQDLTPAGGRKASAGLLVESIDKDGLVGLLSPEPDAHKWDGKSPTKYAVVVDKRNVPNVSATLTKPAKAEQPSAASRIVNEGTGLSLAVPSEDAGERILNVAAKADPQRQWTVTTKDGVSTITNAGTGLLLSVGRGSLKDGMTLVQWGTEKGQGDSQRWTLKDLGGGKVRITNLKSGLCIGMRGGTVVQTAAVDGVDSQAWRIEPANDATGRLAGIMVEAEVGESGVPPRELVVQFSPDVKWIEVLQPEEANPKHFRLIQPGSRAAINLTAGEGRLLILNPPDVDQVYGAAVADVAAVATKVDAVQRNYRNMTVAEIQATVKEIRAQLAAIEEKGMPSNDAGQAAFNLKRLSDSLDSAGWEAKAKAGSPNMRPGRHAAAKAPRDQFSMNLLDFCLGRIATPTALELPPSGAYKCVPYLDHSVFERGAMKARLIGFELIGNTPVTAQGLWQYLSQKPHEMQYGQAKRLLYLDEHEGHAYGLLLTTKSHKKACELINSDGNLKIAITSVADNAERIDFNFIIVRLATQKGLYLQYRGSWNVHSLGMFLNGRYAEASRIARELAVEQANVPQSGKKAKKIRAEYKKPHLDMRVIVREQKLAELLNRLKSINRFEFPLATLTMKSSKFIPLRDAVTTEHHSIMFRPDVTKRSLIAGIIKTIGLAGILAGKVYGKNAAGFDEYVDLVENPDVFAAFDFDDIADEQNLSLTNIRSSALIRSMRGHLDTHKSIFDAPQKKSSGSN